jgi:hypothetical protein
MSVKIECKTYIDEYKGQKWPKELAVRPLPGDYIRSEAGVELKILRVTHVSRKISGSMGAPYREEPVLELILVKDRNLACLENVR